MRAGAHAAGVVSSAFPTPEDDPERVGVMVRSLAMLLDTAYLDGHRDAASIPAIDPPADAARARVGVMVQVLADLLGAAYVAAQRDGEVVECAERGPA